MADDDEGQRVDDIGDGFANAILDLDIAVAQHNRHDQFLDQPEYDDCNDRIEKLTFEELAAK